MGNSDFLFARPSVVTGIARGLDLFGVLQEYNRCRTSEEADAWALYNDFRTVGIDLEKAFAQMEQTLAR